jgi:membrane-associated protease RseP (regulator of RpoE activity)
MNFGKAWFLALGIFQGGSLSHTGQAQEQNPQNESGNVVAQNSQEQTGSTDSVKDGEKSKYSASQSSKGQQNAGKSNSQQGKGAPRSFWRANKDQPNLSFGYQYPNWPNNDQQPPGTYEYNLLYDGQRWLRDSRPQPELNLAAADESVRQHLNLPKGQGVVVLGVAPNSGAAQAGIAQNDILLTLGDTPLGKPEDFYDGLKKAGEKEVPLTLLRSGGRVTLQVQPVVQVTVRPVHKAVRREYWIGVSVTAIEPVLRAQLRLPQNHGVIVNQVYPDSPAAKAGIALHDIIVAVDGNPITDPNDLAKTVQAKATMSLVLKLGQSGGKSRDVTVTPERKKTNETYSVSPANFNTTVYDVVSPGIVLDSATPLYNYNGVVDLLPMIPELSSKSPDGDSALNKRFDVLDSEIKNLRKLVDDLQKTAARIVEQQQK